MAWAAGLFEGEGSFSCASSRVMSRLSSTDEDVVRKFREVVRVGRVYGPAMHGHLGTKPLWTWQVTAFEDVQAIVAMFWRWLGQRRRKKALETLEMGRAMKWTSPKCTQGRRIRYAG
jgi:hypothetical protein